MKNIKSHFQFSAQQRNGIFLLLVIIVLLQCSYFFIENTMSSSRIEKELASNEREMAFFIAEVDSLKRIKEEASKSKIYPFNPNFISDYKGYNLGMTIKEIDRLHHFRNQNKWINSATRFQEVTKVSDSLLLVLAPKFKFPEWVTNPKTPKRQYSNIKFKGTAKSLKEKIDLNKATALQLKKVNGIGEKLSQRIITYRTNQDGFIDAVELNEIYGLSKAVILEMNKVFSLKSPKRVNKIALNKATRDELVTIKYIDYDIANNIIENRKLRAGYKTLNDLEKVKGFPSNKFEIIRLYLSLD